MWRQGTFVWKELFVWTVPGYYCRMWCISTVHLQTSHLITDFFCCCRNVNIPNAAAFSIYWTCIRWPSTILDWSSWLRGRDPQSRHRHPHRSRPNCSSLWPWSLSPRSWSTRSICNELLLWPKPEMRSFSTQSLQTCFLLHHWRWKRAITRPRGITFSILNSSKDVFLTSFTHQSGTSPTAEGIGCQHMSRRVRLIGKQTPSSQLA